MTAMAWWDERVRKEVSTRAGATIKVSRLKQGRPAAQPEPMERLSDELADFPGVHIDNEAAAREHTTSGNIGA